MSASGDDGKGFGYLFLLIVILIAVVFEFVKENFLIVIPVILLLGVAYWAFMNFTEYGQYRRDINKEKAIAKLDAKGLKESIEVERLRVELEKAKSEKGYVVGTAPLRVESEEIDIEIKRLEAKLKTLSIQDKEGRLNIKERILNLKEQKLNL